MPNFLSRIFKVDDHPRQLALALVTQGRIEIENASNKLEVTLKRITREQDRLRASRADER